MKKLNLFIISIFLLLIPFMVSAEDKKKDIYVFYGNGCPHCEEFFTWYDNLSDEVKNKFNIVKYETWYNSDNRSALEKLAEYLEVSDLDDYSNVGVPFIVIGKSYFHGFLESSNGSEILQTLNDYYDSSEEINLIKEYSLDVTADVTPKDQAIKTAVVIVVILLVVAGAGFLIYAVSKTED